MGFRDDKQAAMEQETSIQGQRFDEACQRWEKQGVRLEPGLSDSEIENVERVYRFRFPPDLREFLQYRLPVGPRFINWRDPRDEAREALAWPVEGILFDVEQNGFWWKPWGNRPAEMLDALGIARQALEAAPILVPVQGHRYLPSDPSRANNPVFSVHQSDVLVMHRNLIGWLEDAPHEDFEGKYARRIEFWSDLAEWAQLGHLADWSPGSPDAIGEMHPPTPRRP